MPSTPRERPQPAPRRQTQQAFSHKYIFAIILILTSCIAFSAAAESPRDTDDWTDRSSEFGRGERRRHLLIDLDSGLAKRKDTSSTSRTATATTTKASATSTTASASTSLPSAFDTGLGNNFTSTACPDFIDSFLSNSTFKSCEPISLLLQNSESFFDEEDSLVEMTRTLDASCGADLTTCATLMSSLATELIDDSNCGQDYKDRNALVLQAYSGLVAYEPVYNATCLKNSETGDYCFADAITDEENPSNSYPYYTALGIQLPGGLSLTCNQCLQDTMAVFQVAAANKTQPVSSTYVNSATIIDDNCGPDFVNVTIPSIKSSGTARTVEPASSSYLFPVAVLFVVMMSI